MFNNVREDLLKLKQELQTKYVSFFNDGTSYEDDGNDVINRFEDKIGGFSSNIDSFFEHGVERLCRDNVSFDRIDYIFRLGLITEKSTLGENNEILPTSKILNDRVRFSSKILNDRVRFYTGGINVYNNNELVKNISERELFMGYQGYLDYNTFVKDAKKASMVFVGPQSFEEFKKLILSGEHQDIALSFDFTKKNEIESNEVIEEVKDEQPIQKTKRRSLFRK